MLEFDHQTEEKEEKTSDESVPIETNLNQEEPFFVSVENEVTAKVGQKRSREETDFNSVSSGQD